MAERRGSKNSPSSKRAGRTGRSPHGKKWSPEDPSARPRLTEFPVLESLPTVSTVGDLRRTLEAAEASWSVNEALKDSDPLPVHPLGGVPEGLTPAEAAEPLNWGEVMALPPRNPHLMRRAIELKIISPEGEQLVPLPPTPRPRPRKTTTRKTTAKKTTSGRTTTSRPKKES